MTSFPVGHSDFIDPLFTLPNGVSLVRPYSAAKIVGSHSSNIKQSCFERRMPHIWDGETYLIFVDQRYEGEGGRFVPQRRVHGHLRFPDWRGALSCPPN